MKPQPWTKEEVDLIESNIHMEVNELVELFNRAGTNRSASSVAKKRIAMANLKLKNN